MVKYLPNETSVVFSEIPGEITLAINITNCQNKCINCHSPYLRDNIGEELTTNSLKALIEENIGISCVSFMGEGNDKSRIGELGKFVQSLGLKSAVYSGCMEVPEEYWNCFDYIKIGPYIEALGPLNSKTTNQRLYKKTNDSKFENITSMFWK